MKAISLGFMIIVKTFTIIEVFEYILVYLIMWSSKAVFKDFFFFFTIHVLKFFSKIFNCWVSYK